MSGTIDIPRIAAEFARDFARDMDQFASDRAQLLGLHPDHESSTASGWQRRLRLHVAAILLAERVPELAQVVRAYIEADKAFTACLMNCGEDDAMTAFRAAEEFAHLAEDLADKVRREIPATAHEIMGDTQ